MKALQAVWDDARTWRKVHNLWISEIYQTLKPQVAGRLALSIDQEVTLLELERPPERLGPDLHISEISEIPRAEEARQARASSRAEGSGAVAYAEGVEEVSTESRHYIVIHDLGGTRVVGILEILSPTNKGYYSRRDLERFRERRRELLASPVSYVEVDAVGVGERWLPRCIEELSDHAGVVWASLCESEGEGRRFQGWAWGSSGPLPRIPWDLGAHGTLELELDGTLREALGAAGISRHPRPGQVVDDGLTEGPDFDSTCGK